MSLQRLRHAAVSSFRFYSALVDPGRSDLLDASRRLSGLWRQSGTSPVGGRQGSVNSRLPMVSGWLGSPHELEGSLGVLSRELGSCLQLGKTRGFVGVGTPQPERHRGDRRGRSAVAVRPQVFDAGLPDRRRLEAAVMDWQEPHDQNLSAILPNARQGTFRQTKVRVQRHVEAVLESDCQKSQRCDPRAGPVSSYAEDEQGDRRGPRRRSPALG